MRSADPVHWGSRVYKALNTGESENGQNNWHKRSGAAHRANVTRHYRTRE